MRIFIEKALRVDLDDEEISKGWEYVDDYETSKQAKDIYEQYSLVEGEVIREHLCDHDEEPNSEFKNGCKTNEKELKDGKVISNKNQLKKYFERFNDIETDENGETERVKFAKKLDGKIKRKEVKKEAEKLGV